MKAAGSRRKRFLAAFGIAAAGLVVAVATLPIWFRWALSPVLGHYGIHYESYEAVGWTRFALVGVRGDYDEVWFTSARVEAPLPTGWLSGSRSETEKLGRIGSATDWRVRIEPNHQRPPAERPSSQSSTGEVIEDVEAVLAELRQWVPQARLTNGVVEFGSDRIALAWVTWEAGRVTAAVGPSRFWGGDVVEIRG